ncbi:MAG: hypothetical protein KatS3mg111_4160 [Pirellulaceae bacterium]|nr:MAG: hypothetical protein KatS3mg111_4160 [Pirellulaceae bacterium]
MKSRKVILTSSIIIGTIALLGAGLFAVAGAGIYGSPFAGDTYFNATLLLVLLFGPVAVLPCTLFDWWKPGFGGIILCTLAIFEVVVVVLNNLQEWGFAVHAAALGSLCLAFPVFVTGTLLFFSGNPQVSWLNWAWRFEVLLAATVAAYFMWHVGADGVSALRHLLRGGII